LKGDLGTSFKYQQPVADVIKDKMWISFCISFVALVLELLVAIPLGVMASTKQYSKSDYTVSTFALLGISLPGFFFAGLLRKVFCSDLDLLPFNGLVSSRMLPGADMMTRLLDMGLHLILPIAVLVITGMGSYMRFVRTNMLEVLNSDFVRTARAKGLQEKKVIYKHAFRNTLIPIVTLLGGTLPTLFAGAMITESVFGIPGLGGTAFEALSGSDIPFFMGFNMFLAVLTLAGNLLADILYAVVDPRIRVTK
jgi:peptide/nickel transport system permease protein